MKKEAFKKMLRECLDDWVKANGVKMSKKIHSGGLFMSPTYDVRTVYSVADVERLTIEGFHVETDLGHIALNVIKQ